MTENQPPTDLATTDASELTPVNAPTTVNEPTTGELAGGGEESAALDVPAAVTPPAGPGSEKPASGAEPASADEAASGDELGSGNEPSATEEQLAATEERVVAAVDEAHLVPGQTEMPVGDEVVIDDDTMRRALEAILMVTDEPLPVLTLARTVGRPTGDVSAALTALADEYTEQGRGFDLREVGGGWRYYTRAEAAQYVERFVLDGQQARLTQAALETLAVVAYKQPVSRARVSAIRGVNVDGVMRTLVSRGLVEEAGADTESQATLYRTTSYFLERMGMQSLDDLPELAPYLPEMDDMEEELAAQTPTAETTSEPENPTPEESAGEETELAPAEELEAGGEPELAQEVDPAEIPETTDLPEGDEPAGEDTEAADETDDADDLTDGDLTGGDLTGDEAADFDAADDPGAGGPRSEALGADTGGANAPARFGVDDLTADDLIGDDLTDGDLIADDDQPLAPAEDLEATTEFEQPDDLTADELAPDERADDGLPVDSLANEELTADELAAEDTEVPAEAGAQGGGAGIGDRAGSWSNRDDD